MPQENDITSRVTAGTEANRDNVFGFVTEWVAGVRPAKIKLNDDSEWFLADDSINMYRMLIELSRDHKKPILLAVDKESKMVGMIFSTMIGVPELNGEIGDGKQIQVRVPPSPRVFRLQKDRPWFNAVKAAIIGTQNLSDPTKSHNFWIAFDSVESEIVDVRPVLN